jgi:hypothetical protein
MVRYASKIALLFAVASVGSAGCGGDKKPAAKKPVAKKTDTKQSDVKPETEEDREKKRRAEAVTIIPDGTTCLPPTLKEANAPRLELAAIGTDAVICANDVDRSRLLGPVACWKVELASGGLVYQAANPLPGRSLSLKLEDRCARGFCVPKDAKLPEDGVVHMAWNDDGTKAVMVAGDELHVFDATARSREGGFSIRGDKGVTNTPTAVHWISDAFFIQGKEGPAEHVFVFKLNGDGLGPIMSLGGKEAKLSIHGGSFVVLDKSRVGVVEKGFSTVTTYDVDTGKRAKLVRKVTNGPCKPAEVEAFWSDGDVKDKCRDHMTKTFGHLIGADAVAGKTNLLVLLRGKRLGELAVLDARSLVEKKSIDLPWCEGSNGGKAGADEAPAPDAKPAPKTRGATKKKDAKDKDKEEDPDAGGE